MKTLLLLGSIVIYRVNCQGSSSVTGPLHGGSGGSRFEFECPRNGVLTGIDVHSGEIVDQIGFTCTTSIGKITVGPYGGGGGIAGGHDCPEGQYISSFFGRSGLRLDQIGIRCRKYNDMQSKGLAVEPWGGTGGSFFDDFEYSIGYRPEKIVVRAGFTVDAIQITYVNTEVIVPECINCGYEEVWGEKHGGDVGAAHSFICPADGVITGIIFHSGSLVDQIQFICTSANHRTTYSDRFGGNSGDENIDECPPGSYIGSIHGKSGGHLDKLGIRCVKPGEPGGIKLIAHGGNGGSPFDDDEYARNGRRPVEIRIWSGSQVDAIQIKYGNLPVVLNSTGTRLQLTDESYEDKDGDLKEILLSPK